MVSSGNCNVQRPVTGIIPASVLLLMMASPTFGQSSQRAVFVANNGNLEGSVTSYTIDPDGAPHFVMKYVTGSTPTTQQFHPGTNAQTISVSPDGRYLLVGHGTSNESVEQLTLLRVHADATIAPAGIFQTPDSPLDVEWITNEYAAVTRTSLFVTNQVLLYRFDAEVPSLTLVDQEPTGSFTTSLAVHPSRAFLFAQDSTLNNVHAFAFDAVAGQLQLVDTQNTGGLYPLGLGVSPGGTLLYAGGGISGGGNRIVGMFIDPAGGELTLMAGSPFFSPGSSPKQVVVSADDRYAIVAHGSDSTVRTFTIDSETGVLTPTGFVFDVGIQGSLGEIASLDDLVLVLDRDTVIDGVRGLYSFTLRFDGALIQNGPLVDSQGVSPHQLAVWSPPSVLGDADNDGDVDLYDFDAYGQCYTGPDEPSQNGHCLDAFDSDEDGDIDWADFRAFQTLFTGSE